MVIPTPKRIKEKFAAWLRGTSANVATMTALAMPVGIALAAVAIDAGALYTERRGAQSLADLAAITAAANIDKAAEAAMLVLKDNGRNKVVVQDQAHSAEIDGDVADASLLTVVTGRYTGQASVPVTLRFAPGGKPSNAVKVTLRQQGSRYFGSALLSPTMIETEAVANRSAEAAFSVGSRLLKVEGGILNALLGALIGGNITLTAMDYQSLLATDIELFTFLDKLATRVNVKGPTYSDVLKSKVTVGDFARAMADVPTLDHATKLALQAIAGGASAAVTVPLSHVVDLGPAANLRLGDRPAGVSAGVNALQMLTAAAAVADGRNQARVNLGLNVPGLLGATLDLAIGEPAQFAPWFTLGETGDIVRTAQTRLLLTVNVLGPGGLIGTSVKLPIYVEVAYAEAKLTSISCSSGSDDSVRVGVAARPGIASVRIGETDAKSLADFRSAPALTPALMVTAPLVAVRGQALVNVGNQNWSNLSFNRKEITDKTVKTVTTSNFTQSLTGSLLGNLKLDVTVLGLGIGLPDLAKAALTTTLSGITPAVDNLLYSVLTSLGVKLGEADIRVHGATCGRAVLVQ